MDGKKDKDGWTHNGRKKKGLIDDNFLFLLPK